MPIDKYYKALNEIFKYKLALRYWFLNSCYTHLFIPNQAAIVKNVNYKIKICVLHACR